MRSYRVIQSCVFCAAVTVLAMAQPLWAQDPGSVGVSMTTWQNDTHRSGRNLSEGTLVTNGGTTIPGLQQICASATLDGQVYAQPLIETSVHVGGKYYKYGAAYVVTQNDTLYAIDANPNDGNTPCNIIASLPLLPILSVITHTTHSAVACSGIGSGGCPVKPIIGILGTPVINISGTNGYIYLVTYSQDTSGNYYHYFHAIDIQTLTEAAKSPQLIAPPGQSATTFSFQHIQRPGLLYANGYVYVAFSMIDGYPYPYPNGVVFGFKASDLTATPIYFQTSTGLLDPSNGGGIWQGGSAPAYGRDQSGTNYIYLKTANGSFGTLNGVTSWGDSLLKLDPTTLTVPTGGYFTPADQIYRSNSQCAYNWQNNGLDKSPSPGDMDFGSGGVMLIPDTDLTTWPYLAVSGDKEGGIWFNDRTSPGGHNTTCDNYSTLAQQCLCSTSDSVVQTYWTSLANYGQVIHNGPAYWKGNGNNYLYLSTQDWGAQKLHGKLTRYALCSIAGATDPIGGCGDPVDAEDLTPTAVNFPYGVTPSISAASAGTTDAVVWTIWGDGSALGSSKVAVLYAFDAADTTGTGKLQELYQSTGSDAMTTAATKFSVPTVANGCVYIGTQGPSGGNGNSGMFYIFGISGKCAQ